jgi:hypothetical protein
MRNWGLEGEFNGVAPRHVQQKMSLSIRSFHYLSRLLALTIYTEVQQMPILSKTVTRYVK